MAIIESRNFFCLNATSSRKPRTTQILQILSILLCFCLACLSGGRVSSCAVASASGQLLFDRNGPAAETRPTVWTNSKQDELDPDHCEEAASFFRIADRYKGSRPGILHPAHLTQSGNSFCNNTPTTTHVLAEDRGEPRGSVDTDLKPLMPDLESTRSSFVHEN